MGENISFKVPSQPVIINRRHFVMTTAVAGGGLMVGLVPAGKAGAASTDPQPWVQGEGTEFTAMLSILPDNTVIVRGTTPDIGNGTFTSAPMMVKEELHADWDLIKGEYLPVARDIKDGGMYSAPGYLTYFSGRSTGGEAQEMILQLAASTRERLIHAAANRWGVEPSGVVAENSILTNTANGETLTFGDVAADAAGIELEQEPALKDYKEWTFIGKETPKKLQLPLILNGSAVYGLDVQVPGMLVAALRQSPAHGGRIISVDADAVMGMPGVRHVVVVDPDEVRPGLPEGQRAPFGLFAANAAQAAVAVIADHYWQAQAALDVLPVEWDDGEGAQWENTQQVYDALNALVENPVEPNIVVNQGDAAGIIAAGASAESQYLTPYMEHFNMEPLNGTALVTEDRVEAWLPTQHPQQALFVIGDETGVAPENIDVHQTWIGTGFGRRVFGDDVRMVAAVAKAVPGTPIKVIWSREESMRQGRFRQIMAGKLTGKVDAEGYPEALHISTAGSGPSTTGIADSPYMTGIPNYLVQTQNFDTNLKTGPWRGPVFNSNCFMLETFVNEMAEEAGIDAIEYRRKLLANYEDSSWINLLDEVAEKAGWGSELPSGQAQGVAIGNWGMAARQEGGPTPLSGTTCAVIVTAEITRRGEILIPRVDVAVDTGSYFNADAIAQQVEGGVILSLGAAYHEELNINNGRVVEGNLDTYNLMRQNDPLLPLEIHTHLGAMVGDYRFSEIGEPPMGPPPPALAHAIYKLTGTWMRSHPFSKIRLG